MTPKKVNQTQELIVPGDYDATINYCVEQFKTAAINAIEQRGNFYVALSGGETPRAIFQKLSQYKSLPWSNIHIFWSDERCVPPDSRESNYHMAKESGLLSLINEKHIHRMQGEDDPKLEAHRYESVIGKTVPNGIFDLVTLGIGEDGHTASLFPETEGLKANKSLVVANYVPQKKCWRLTLTFACINQSREIVVYALGEHKAKIIKEIFDTPPHLPIQFVGTPKNKTKIVADLAATQLI